MNTNKKITGFSLIELMIVVAIIGILAAVALPSYNKYVKRAKATEVLALYSAIKIHMVAYHLETGEWPANNGNLSLRNADIDLGDVDSYSTDTIENAWVGTGGVLSKAFSESGHIAITYKDGALHKNPNKRGGMFLATVERVNGRYTWICNNTTARWRSTMNYDYLPETCHN